jgi:hypothetical protein
LPLRLRNVIFKERFHHRDTESTEKTENSRTENSKKDLWDLIV